MGLFLGTVWLGFAATGGGPFALYGALADYGFTMWHVQDAIDNCPTLIL